VGTLGNGVPKLVWAVVMGLPRLFEVRIEKGQPVVGIGT
jgi:hypothetical protein